jgi:hypothetical protein
MGPAGASTRAGREGAKIVEKRGLLPAGRFNAAKKPGKIIGEGPDHPRRTFEAPESWPSFSCGAMIIAAGGSETHYVRVTASRTVRRMIQIETCSTE